jgi:hypothetical protein
VARTSTALGAHTRLGADASTLGCPRRIVRATRRPGPGLRQIGRARWRGAEVGPGGRAAAFRAERLPRRKRRHETLLARKPHRSGYDPGDTLTHAVRVRCTVDRSRTDRHPMPNPEIFLESFLEPSRIHWSPVRGTAHPVFRHEPAGVTVALGPGPVAWLAAFERQPETSKMWQLSLGYIPLMTGDPATLRAVLEDFENALQSPAAPDYLYRIGSADHCTAIRLRTLCHGYLSTADEDLRSRIRRIAARDCDWVRRPGTLAANNHGVMLATAALHACAMIPFADRDRRDTERIAMGFLTGFVPAIFDDQGLAYENTVGYHELYLKVLRPLRAFAGLVPSLAPLAAMLDALLPRVDEALHRIVWPCGGIPPIGDSGVYRTRHPSVDGLHVFEQSGFAVWKRDGLYLSFVCGARAEFHKHVDDTSITLRVDGVDLILDSGGYSYDWRDPLRQCVASQRGHSGLFFERFDRHLRKQFLAAAAPYAAGLSHWRDDGGVAHVAGSCSMMGGTHRTRRELAFDGDRAFTITDGYDSDAGESPVQRYIIPVEATVTAGDAGLTIVNQAVRATLTLPARSAVSVMVGHAHGLHKGWRSTGFGRIEPSLCVEVRPPPGVQPLVTRVALG